MTGSEAGSVLAAEAGGNRLLGFAPGGEADPATTTADGPLPLALAVVVADGRVLVAWHRWREHWELPGGMIDAGESAHDAAVRELAEETGVVVPSLRLVGVASFELAPDRRRERGAVFRGDAPAAWASSTASAAFEPNDEMSRVHRWDPATDLAGLSPIDAWLARAALDGTP